MAVGMGQMETKVFPVNFPEDFEVRDSRGALTARVIPLRPSVRLLLLRPYLVLRRCYMHFKPYPLSICNRYMLKAR